MDELAPQQSELLEWNLLNRLRSPCSPHESQLVAQLVVQAGWCAGAQVVWEPPQVSQPQLECLKRFNSRFRQPSSQHESQALPQHAEVAAGAGAAGAAGGAESAPARQAVVTSKNAAFT
ncbi:MAG TPA: hypothetical protein VKE94_23960 [Gemmataceae bacterium]|nr:hypothetical protein [Gemmataceae bacterium]